MAQWLKVLACCSPKDLSLFFSVIWGISCSTADAIAAHSVCRSSRRYRFSAISCLFKKLIASSPVSKSSNICEISISPVFCSIRHSPDLRSRTNRRLHSSFRQIQPGSGVVKACQSPDCFSPLHLLENRIVFESNTVWPSCFALRQGCGALLHNSQGACLACRLGPEQSPLAIFPAP